MTREQRTHVLYGPLKVWAALLVLLAATLGYAYWPHAPAKPAVSLAIAATKAGLVAVLFMQIKTAPWLVRLAALAGLVWLSFLFAITFSDYLTR